MNEKHPDIDVLDTYKNGRTKVKLRCKICNYQYSATPGSLYMGCGCPKCAGVARKTTQQFIEEMLNVNPNVVIDGEYVQNKAKINVHCLVCGYVWKSTPNSLLRGNGCAKCSGLLRKTNEQFLLEMKEIHPNIVALDNYTNNHTKIICHCNICNRNFTKTPHALIDAKSGCTFCSKANTKGEIAIRDWLIENNIDYIKQKSFKGCKDKQRLLFDFYLPKYNIAIEYDGKQHFEPVDWGFHDEELMIANFKDLQNRDKIKNKYCEDNGVKLIRIPYTEFDNIEMILKENLN